MFFFTVPEPALGGHVIAIITNADISTMFDPKSEIF
jgi:hypothetical protein